MSSLSEITAPAGTPFAFLSALCDASFDSVLLTDATPAGAIVYANAAFTALTGYSLDSVRGKSPKILQGAGTQQSVIQRLTDALREGGCFEGKAVNYRLDGTAFIMHWRVVPVRVEGVIKYWLAVQRECSSSA